MLKKNFNKILYNKILWRIRTKSFIFGAPKYIFISFMFYFSILMRKPIKKDLIYPVRIDVQRISGVC
jgi:hypothetical protein